jgi:hypothetical protein
VLLATPVVKVLVECGIFLMQGKREPLLHGVVGGHAVRDDLCPAEQDVA